MKTPTQLCSPRAARPEQRGVVLILSLIILAVMLVSAAALVRSFETTLFSSGNLVFKRDLANQGERATAAVLAEFKPTGALGTTASRANPVPSQNYSATVLPSNAQGLPLALLDDTLFAAVAGKADITPGGSAAVTVRYLVDRMCTEIGEDVLLGPEKCSVAENTLLPGGSSSN